MSQIVQNLIHSLRHNDHEMEKVATDKLGSLVSQRLFESGIARKIWPMQKVTPNMLHPDLYSEEPRMILEIDAQSPSAASVSFLDRADLKTYSGMKYELRFFKIQSPEYVKNEIHLMTYQHDISKMLKEKISYGIEDEEDTAIFDQLKIIAAGGEEITYDGSNRPTLNNPAINKYHNGTSYVATTGSSKETIQTVFFNSGVEFTPASVRYGIDLLLIKKLEPQMILCHEILYGQRINWTTIEVGRLIVHENVSTNLLKKANRDLLGIPVFTTLKTEIIPTNEMWIFTDPKFLGKFAQLDDLVFAVNRAQDGFITMKAHELIGFSIGNTKAVIRLIWDNATIDPFSEIA